MRSREEEGAVRPGPELVRTAWKPCRRSAPRIVSSSVPRHEGALRQYRPPRPNPWKGLSATGIDKRPVVGPVAVADPGPKGTGTVGLAGVRASDVQHHGGCDQAVYAHAREDLDAWETELGRPLTHGAFGENLTTLGLDVNGALIGERWRIGPDVVLEVACPRIPCATFQGWLRRDG